MQAGAGHKNSVPEEDMQELNSCKKLGSSNGHQWEGIRNALSTNSESSWERLPEPRTILGRKISLCEVETSSLNHMYLCGNPKVRNYHKNFHTENCKTLQKECKEDINKWKSALCSRARKLSIVEMSGFLKLIYRFYVIPIQNLSSFFNVENNKLI